MIDLAPLARRPPAPSAVLHLRESEWPLVAAEVRRLSALLAAEGLDPGAPETRLSLRRQALCRAAGLPVEALLPHAAVEVRYLPDAAGRRAREAARRAWLAFNPGRAADWPAEPEREALPALPGARWGGRLDILDPPRVVLV